MSLLSSSLRSGALGLIVLVLLAAACTGGAPEEDLTGDLDAIQLEDPARRYSAEWLIDTRAIDLEDVPSPLIYREVVDDLTGTYLAEGPGHLALQNPDEVVFCAAVSRLPLDPFCASSPRAEGAPYVLSYPIQLIRGDWSPRALYDLAGYREVSLVAESDPENWSISLTRAPSGFPIECFLVLGDTSAASEGFEICYTNDDLHLVASVDLQNDLVFEIELLSYELVQVSEKFETGLDDFIEERPELQEQLLDLYPELPAPRPEPTPDPNADADADS